MKPWHVAALCLLCLALPGCRTKPVVTDLEKENTDLENKIWEMDGQLQEQKQDLENCRKENERLRQQSGGAAAEPSPPELTLPRGLSGLIPSLRGPGEEKPPQPLPPSGPSQRKLPSTTPELPINPESLRPPEVILPDTSVPAEEALKHLLPGGGATPPSPPGQTPAGQAPQGTEPAPSLNVPGVPPAGGGAASAPLDDNRQVAAITFDESATGGVDADHQPGDEGFVVCLEPRGQGGQLLRAAAPVSVVVVDPSAPGGPTRVARWDFTADEVAAAIAQGGATEGIRLGMRWPSPAPSHGPLLVAARYATDDGRKLDAEHELAVNTPGAAPASWTASQSPGPASPTQPAADDRWQRNPQPSVPAPPPASPAPPASPPADPAPPATLPASPADSSPVRMVTRPEPPASLPPPAAPRVPRPVWSPYRAN